MASGKTANLASGSAGVILRLIARVQRGKIVAVLKEPDHVPPVPAIVSVRGLGSYTLGSRVLGT